MFVMTVYFLIRLIVLERKTPVVQYIVRPFTDRGMNVPGY
jgi:hypothetical protein